MNTSSILIWENRLTRLSLALLLLAAAYGIAAGAAITMYYDITPNMGSIEDKLGLVLLTLYLLAVLVGLIHLPLALGDFKNKLWRQALIRTAVSICPIIIFIGAEGLISHYLWWAPISDTDRFHILHHSVVAGAPLTLFYGLGLFKWWQPATFTIAPSPSPRLWAVSGLLLLWLAMPIGIMFGIVTPPTAGVGTLIIILAIVVLALWPLTSFGKM